jgi:regulator of nucleoside diphosphate kinase
MRNRIYVTNEDMQRLRQLVENLQASVTADTQNLAKLEEELDRAHVVDAKKIPRDVITLNSQVRIMDLDTGRVFEYEVVYPNTRTHSSADPLSVLAPLGTALLGYRAGDTINWSVPRGKRRLKVLEIIYQPEAKGASAA